jgi:glc operon protein GlcG
VVAHDLELPGDGVPDAPRDAAEEAARDRGLALTFAVVDSAGHPVALHRMDGAPWITPDVALGKAWTAAAYAAPSAAQGEKMRELVAFSASVSVATGGRFTPQIGGLPIVVDGQSAGAMGASGASGQEDEECVRAGLEAVGVASAGG